MRWIIYSITITVAPHERHGEWEHQAHRFFQRHFLANNTQNTLSLQGRDMSTMALQINGNLNAGSTAWSLCEGNHRSPVNSPHREPTTQFYFFCISVDKRLNKRLDCQQFETIGCSLWRHCNALPNRRQMCIFCSNVTTNPCEKKKISTLGTLLGAIESLLIVLA